MTYSKKTLDDYQLDLYALLNPKDPLTGRRKDPDYLGAAKLFFDPDYKVVIEPKRGITILPFRNIYHHLAQDAKTVFLNKIKNGTINSDGIKLTSHEKEIVIAEIEKPLVGIHNLKLTLEQITLKS